MQHDSTINYQWNGQVTAKIDVIWLLSNLVELFGRKKKTKNDT